MTPIKRKSSTETDNARPKKKQKPILPNSELSILKEEEPAFPRGGASVLTPLEYKQVHIQATQDVLFEQSTGKKLHNDEFEDEENEKVRFDSVNRHPSNTRKKKPSQKKLEKPFRVGEEKPIRIQGLSYTVSDGNMLDEI